jgi:DNA-binding transcriptional ArsR family regulator
VLGDGRQVEAQTALRAAEADGAELVGVGVDPVAFDAQQHSDVCGVDQARGCRAIGEELGDALSNALDVPVFKHCGLLPNLDSGIVIHGLATHTDKFVIAVCGFERLLYFRHHPAMAEMSAARVSRLRERSKLLFGNADRLEVAHAVAQDPTGVVYAQALSHRTGLTPPRVRAQLLAFEAGGLMIQLPRQGQAVYYERTSDPFWKMIVALVEAWD